MVFWHEIPLLRFFLAFLTGVLIVCGTGTTLSLSPWFYLLPGCIFSAYILYPKKLITYQTRWILGLSVYLLAALLGYNVTIIRDLRSAPDWFGSLKPTEYEAVYTVQLLEEPVRKGKYLKTKASVIKTVLVRNQHCRALNVSGKGLIYVETAETDSLAYGDRLLIRGTWRSTPKAMNPGSFDYSKYLYFKHIHHVIYIKKHNWKIIGRNQGNPVMALAKKWQNALVQIYDQNNMGKDEQAVGSAMILGKYEDFSDELRDSYSAAGVTHILSVSGLHVGIVFVVFNHMLFFLNRGQISRIVKAILMIAITWFYALLTGLSPPVMRAAAMFTFLIIGKMRNRNSNILNTLASSALLLMLMDPFLIADIGFELSYLAVAGIVLAGNPLYQLYTPSNYLVDKTWQLIAISLGAQLFTAPLAIYNFMQFPLYFIPANLLIIPLSTVVMYAGMAVLAFEQIPYLSEVLNWCFNSSIKLMNFLIAQIEDWPYASLKGLFLTSWEALILAGITIMVCLIIHLKYQKSLLIILILSSVWLASSSIRKSLPYMNNEFIVYSTRKGMGIGFQENRQLKLLTINTDTVYLKKQTVRHCKSMGINNIETVPVDSVSGIGNQESHINIKFLRWKQQKIIMISGAGRIPPQNKPFEADILVLSNIKYKASKNILATFDPKLLILCQDIPAGTNRYLTEQCRKTGIRVFDIRRNGAFIWSEHQPEQ
jgi:competence protein ComEC